MTLLSRDKFVSEQGCKATEATWFSGGGWVGLKINVKLKNLATVFKAINYYLHLHTLDDYYLESAWRLLDWKQLRAE